MTRLRKVRERNKEKKEQHLAFKVFHVFVSVDELPLSNKERASLRRADLVNAAQILYASPSENATLRQLFDSTHFERIQEKAAFAQAPRSYSTLELLEKKEKGSIKKEIGDCEEAVTSDEVMASRRSGADVIDESARYTLSTGDIAIDGLLGGGIRRGCLTEIVGESSSGKSQLGMQTAVFTAVGFATMLDRSPPTLTDEGDELYEALAGRGIRPKSQTGSVAILNSGGAAISRMLTRRMVELSNSLVAERWKQGRENAMSVTSVNWKTASLEDDKAGIFRDEFKRSNLEETQQMAKARLLENIKLCSPKDYESLEHTISYFLPALKEQMQRKGKAPLTLVIVDDLPTLLIDNGDANMTQKEHTLRRSRYVCEIADRLKRLSVSGIGSQPALAVAIMVMNQVIDAMATNKRLLLPLLLPNAWIDHDSSLLIEGPPPLSSAFQEGFFNGLLASADISAVTKAREDIAEGREEEEALNRVSSTSKMAALGYSWVNCINVRVMLTRTNHFLRRNLKEKITIRRAVSVINPFAKAGQGWNPHVEYAVLPEGVKSIHSISSRLKRSGVDDEDEDEDALWSSFDTDFKSNEVNLLIDREEQSRIDQEDEYLWAMSSDLDDDLDLPDIQTM